MILVLYYFSFQFCDVVEWNHLEDDFAKFGYKIESKKKINHPSTLLATCMNLV
jgi:hypothetical protein